MLPDARAYLDEVLDYIERHSIEREGVDWPALRRDAHALARGAGTTGQTYPAIRLALEHLGDRHSFLVTPEELRSRREGVQRIPGLAAVYPEGVVVRVLPGSPAEAAGVHEGDTIETVDGTPVAALDRGAFQAALWGATVTLRLKRAGADRPVEVTLHAADSSVMLSPQGRRLEPEVGYLELPAIVGDEAAVRAYAATAQRLIRELAQGGARRWVVDLRRNGGGNMWPMLAGVGPLLGEGDLGAFAYLERRDPWGYRAGQALLGRQALARVDEPYQLARPSPPVAVLVSRLTASSGEITLLAFQGRPHTRTFGEPTAGVPTCNDTEELRDGAVLHLTVALGADRTGRTYAGPVAPDEPVAADWTRFGSDADPVLRAAVAWLRRQALPAPGSGGG